MNINKLDENIEVPKLQSIISILLVLALVLAGIVVMPVVGENGDEEKNYQKAGSRWSKTLYVGEDQTYIKIQDAIDNASTGDTIRVYAGTYYENIIVDKTLTLIGNGTENTTIDGGGSGNVIYINYGMVLISGFTIIGSGSNWDNSGIYIYNAENCWIENNNCSNNQNGIFIYANSNDNTIINNICNSNIIGGISCGARNTLINNTCNSNGMSGLSCGSNNTVINNTCNLNKAEGISLSSSRNYLKNNTCNSNHGNGIYTLQSFENKFENNNCSYNDINGICLKSPSENELKNNSCNLNNENGIYFEAANYNTLENNNCNSNEVYGIYFNGNPQSCNNNLIKYCNCNLNGMDGIFLYNSRQFSLIDNICNLNENNGICISYQSYWNKIIHCNCNSNFYYGIYLKSTFTTKIDKNNCSNNKYGIFLEDSRSNKLFNNNCNSNTLYGIFLEVSSNKNILKNNFCNSNKNDGIFLTDSTNNNLENNSCKLNGINGINIQGSMDNTLSSNNCILNGINGINIQYSMDNTLKGNNCSENTAGIRFQMLLKNILENNLCKMNNDYGILLIDSYNNTINNNLISSNNNYGICLTNSENNKIYHNNIISNGKQAFDDSINGNQWNLSQSKSCSKEGNYWSDWTKPNNNTDPFVDNPYIIPGGSNQDKWPFFIQNGWEFDVHNLKLETGHHSIQEAINKASIGDIIWVKSGTYHENIVINKTITLIGENRNTTIINGDGIGDVLYLSANWINITGFKIKNSGINLGNTGIKLDNVYNCTIKNNNISLKNDYGIFIRNSESINILKNIISYNNDNGIYIDGSNNNTIVENVVMSNNNYGIYLTKSFNNKIYKNNFINNDKQAYDDSLKGNKWNLSKNNSGGNYWFYWTTPDNDKDGFVDKPYNIDGGIGANDYLPLVYPWGKIPPLIITKNIEITFIEKLYFVNYSAFDPDTPNHKLIWTMETNASWLNFLSNHSLSGLPRTLDIGWYWVNISVSDGHRNSYTNFSLIIFPKIPPEIYTDIITTAIEGQVYTIQYRVIDPDTTQKKINWSFNTNASWLNFSSTQQLHGIPSNFDVGMYWVNISVFDGDFTDFINFTITVSYKKEEFDQKSPKISIKNLINNSSNIAVDIAEIIFEFSTQMNISSIENALNISPFINYTLKWEKNNTVLFIIFNEKLLYETTYNISIGINGMDSEGNTLKTTYNLLFTTEKKAKIEDNGKLMDFDFIKITIYIGMIFLIIFIIILLFITKSRRKQKEKSEKKKFKIEGRDEFESPDIIDKYPYEEVSIGNSEDYIKKLMDEALEFKKPSEFLTPEEKMLKEAENKYRKGQISKATYHSIKETLTKKNL